MKIPRHHSRSTEIMPSPKLEEMEKISLYIAGRNGKLGSDLGQVALANGLTIASNPTNVNYVALCTPSNISLPLLQSNTFEGKTIIDLSGAAKLMDDSQYGLMKDPSSPWSSSFNPESRIFSNSGCIASATIMGLAKAGLTEIMPPKNISVFSVGGRSHSQSIGTDEIKLARRLNSHPHIGEIEGAFNNLLKVESFMPTICDTPTGLLVSVHGKTICHPEIDLGEDNLSVNEVIGTSSLKHRLELPSIKTEDYEEISFSLAVAIDNLRFVTENAVNLIRFIDNSR